MTTTQWITAPPPGIAIPYRYPNAPEPLVPSGFKIGSKGVWDRPDALAIRNGTPGRMLKAGAYWADPVDLLINKLAVVPDYAVTLVGITVTVVGAANGITVFDPAAQHWTIELLPVETAPVNSFGVNAFKTFDLPVNPTLQSVVVGGAADTWATNAPVFVTEAINRGFRVRVSPPRWSPSDSTGEWQIDGFLVTVYADLPPEALLPSIPSVAFGGRQWPQMPRSSVTGDLPPTAALQPGSIGLNMVDLELFLADDYREPRKMIGVRYHSARAVYHEGDLVVAQGAIWVAPGTIAAGDFNEAQWLPASTPAEIDEGFY